MKNWPLKTAACLIAFAVLAVIVYLCLPFDRSAVPSADALPPKIQQPAPESVDAVGVAEMDIPLLEADALRADANDLTDPEAGMPDMHSAVIRSWTGHLEPSLAVLVAGFEAGELSRFVLPTFAGDSVEVRIRRTRKNNMGAQLLSGVVEGEPGSMVSLVQHRHALAGGVLIPSQGKTYEIRPAEDGGVVFSEIDIHALGDCHICMAAAELKTARVDVLPVPLSLPMEH